SNEGSRHDFRIVHLALPVFLMMHSFQQIVTQAEDHCNFVVHGLPPLGDEMRVSPLIWRKKLMDSISSNLGYLLPQPPVTVASDGPDRGSSQGWRPDVVLVRLGRGACPGGLLHRPHPQGCQSGRSPRAAADKILADPQPEDRQGTRTHHSPAPFGAGGRGDP